MFLEEPGTTKPLQMPVGHSNVNTDDIEMCPFMSSNNKDEFSGGGCPVM